MNIALFRSYLVNWQNYRRAGSELGNASRVAPPYLSPAALAGRCGAQTFSAFFLATARPGAWRSYPYLPKVPLRNKVPT